MAYKQVIAVRADLKLGKGKLAAQAAHASLEAYLKARQKAPDAVEEWLRSGAEKVVVKVGGEGELLELFEKLRKLFPCALIQDAGRTQIEPGTKTCVGIGPAKEMELDKFTGHLKLM